MPRSDRGFTLIELLIVVAIISIIAAFAVPGLLRSKMTANEASAVASLRAINISQVSYQTSCGGGGYAASLPVLGAPTPGTTHPFLSADLTGAVTVVKSSYTVTMGPGAGSVAGPTDCNGTATITAFYATAVPQTHGVTGTRSFALTGGSTIWQNFTAVAPTEPFGAPSTPAQ